MSFQKWQNSPFYYHYGCPKHRRKKGTDFVLRNTSGNLYLKQDLSPSGFLPTKSMSNMLEICSLKPSWYLFLLWFFGSLWSHGLTFQHSINSVYKVINHQTTGNKTSLSSQVIFFLFPFSHFVYCSPSNFWDGVLQTAVCIIPWAWFLGYISFLKQIGTPWYIIPSLSNSQGGTELKWLRQFAKAISLPNARSVLEHTAVKRKCLHFYGFSYEVSGNRTEYLLL